MPVLRFARGSVRLVGSCEHHATVRWLAREDARSPLLRHIVRQAADGRLVFLLHHVLDCPRAVVVCINKPQRVDRQLLVPELRYEPPALWTSRYTTEPIEVAGGEIPADANVLFSSVAANRDPARYTDPDRPRPFRVPFVWPVTIVGSVLCLYVMRGLPRQAWERFGWWLVIGLVLYFSYGFRHSTLRRAARGENLDLV